MQIGKEEIQLSSSTDGFKHRVQTDVQTDNYRGVSLAKSPVCVYTTRPENKMFKRQYVQWTNIRFCGFLYRNHKIIYRGMKEA
jgi:CRISPR/Cas system endoribonuclease Cas6 (RAMP superfamily)